MIAQQPGCPPSRERSRQFAVRVLIVALLAASAASLIFVSVNRDSRLGWVVNQFASALIYSVSIAVPSALALNYISHLPFAKRRYRSVPVVVPVIVGTLLVTAVLGCLFAGVLLILFRMCSWDLYWTRFESSIVFSIVITLTFGLSAWFYEMMRERLEAATVEHERALKLLTQAQLSSLESRIHPHFLFNTLNSIASLIPNDPERAEDMVGKLASLLRFSLNANQAGLVPLAQELKVVRDYLEIEKARFGARLRYSIDVPADLGEAAVPPLAVESLVENSIKHAIAPDPAGGEVRVSAVAAGGRIDLEVTDSGNGFSLETILPGHGIDNLSGRLRLLFGDDARLAVSRANGYSSVQVSLPREPVTR